MPKTIYLPKDAGNSGISVTWTKTTGTIAISGWFDSMVGIDGGKMTLREFFDALGITERDCARAWRAKVVDHA